MTQFFTTSIDDQATIVKIADRIMACSSPAYADKLTAIIDLSLTHALVCPLDLNRLLAAPENHFLHDIFGIKKHLDREKAVFEPMYRPRYARIQ